MPLTAVAGAEGQNRTDDTSIFSAVLYLLSYLGDKNIIIIARRSVKFKARIRLEFFKVISLDERGHMWASGGALRAICAGYGWLCRKTLRAIVGRTLIAGGRNESIFLRLLERLPDTERYKIDAYVVYVYLPMNKCRVGKGAQ